MKLNGPGGSPMDADLKAAGERHAGPHDCRGDGIGIRQYEAGTEDGSCDAVRFRDALDAAEADADALAEALRDLLHEASEVLLDHEDGTQFFGTYADLVTAVEDARRALGEHAKAVTQPAHDARRQP